MVVYIPFNALLGYIETAITKDKIKDDTAFRNMLVKKPILASSLRFHGQRANNYTMEALQNS